ncbi:MAG: CocE/NonD family hydrolase [Parachlamydiaceae bacterium]
MRTVFYSLAFCFLISIASHAEKPDLTIAIKMRDGVELPTDIYLPPKPEGKSPAILIRSPSGRKSPYATMFCYLKSFGYSVVIQDTRSVMDKEGKTLPFYTDGAGEIQDGYDTVQWLNSSPYCNGSLGTIGTSSMGITQLLLAPTAPQGLKCQYICFAVPDLFNHSISHAGKLAGQQVKLWTKIYAKDPSSLDTILSQPEYNDFWAKFNSKPLAHQVNIPAIHFGGWYDTFLQGTLDAYMTLQTQGGEGAKGKQKLIIGPWIHLWPLVNQFGDFSYPASAFVPPYPFKPEDWFAHYLKNEQNGIEKIPPVTYFVMGPFDGSSSSGNRWKSAPSWPPASTPKPFYLSAAQTLDSKPGEKRVFSFKYNPENPSHTLGGRNLFLTSGPVDQSPIEAREDIVLFTSEPLKEDLEVTGSITAKIYFSTDQQDHDVVVRLCDVYPDGKSVLIAEGITNLKNFFKRQKMNEAIPNNVKEIEVDLWATSMVFARGHSIRISVASANYPKYEKSLFKALNTVYVGTEHPSRVILPIAPINELKD